MAAARRSACSAPYIEVDGAGTGTVPPIRRWEELTIESVNVGEPFTSCGNQSSPSPCSANDGSGRDRNGDSVPERRMAYSFQGHQ